MKRTCLLIAATAAVLAACGTAKPAPSDKIPESAALPEAAAPPAIAEPASPASPQAPPVKPAGAPTPVAAKPVVEPAAPPPPKAAVAAPVVTPPPAPVAAPTPSAPPVDPLMGKPLYEAQCRKCHGVIGVPPKAIASKFPKLVPFDAAYFSKTTDDAVVSILTQGKGDDMKSFKEKLSKPEMAAVAAYIRTLGQRP